MLGQRVGAGELPGQDGNCLGCAQMGEGGDPKCMLGEGLDPEGPLRGECPVKKGASDLRCGGEGSVEGPVSG
jgi:hypothetical protein